MPQKSLVSILLIIGILIFVNILGNIFYTHLDLTEDSRFTLTKASKKLLKGLNDEVTVEVYLDGEFPALFKRLKNATRDMLEEFRDISGNIKYRFINPNEGTAEQRNSFAKQLRDKEIYPVNLTVGTSQKKENLLIFPYALVRYQGREKVVNLLENQVAGRSEEQIVNYSIGLLEYKLANAIQQIQVIDRPLIAFTTGHGELGGIGMAALVKSLREFYDIEPLKMDSITTIPPIVKILVVAKPRREFGDKHKFLIDQYLMRGGNVIWLLDRLNVETDSLNDKPVYAPYEYPLDIDDMLFRYGVRVNADLVSDLRCTRIPVVKGMMGDKPQTELEKWFYHTIAFNDNDKATAVKTGNPLNNHPIVKNIDGVDLRFPSSIDTIKTKSNVQKTILLRSSQYSRIQFVPVRLSLEFAGIEEQVEKFNKPHIPLAVLLEGSFNSAFENRVSPEMMAELEQIKMPYRSLSEPAKQLVVSDGDIGRNDFDRKTGNPMPLGYNRYENYNFGNKDFLFNAIEYMLDNSGIISARSKEVKMRLMNKVRIENEKSYWQLFNIVMPLLILGVFGILHRWWRKRKYAA